MVFVRPAIKTNVLDLDLRRPLSNNSADFSRGIPVTTILDLAGHYFLLSRRRSKGSAIQIIDDLDSNMLVTARNTQAGLFSITADPPPYPPSTAKSLPRDPSVFVHVLFYPLLEPAPGYPPGVVWCDDAVSINYLLIYCAVLPALRRTTSPAYRIPLPL